MDEELYKNHQGAKEHYWLSDYIQIDNLKTFIGISCECGAFVSADNLVSIINSYQGNRIVPGHVIFHVEKGRRI